MKKNLKLIYILYTLSILIIITVSVIFYSKLNELKSTSDNLVHTHKIINHLQKIRLLLVTGEANQRAFFLRNDSSLIKPSTELHKEILNELTELQQMVSKKKDQISNLVMMRSIISDRFQLMQFTRDNYIKKNIGNFDESFKRGLIIMEQFDLYAKKMEDREKEILQARSAEKHATEHVVPRYLLVILIITCLFQLLSFLFMQKEIKRRHQYQKELENMIRDLHVTNAELEQIAFVASHDLQEPLRKIRTFTDLLVHKQKNNLTEEGQQILTRLSEAALRMQGLIEDLVNYTSIIESNGDMKLVNLNDPLTYVLTSLNDKIIESKAIINIELLPQTLAHANQLQLLFFNLIDNALKFSRPGIIPVISISTSRVTGKEFLKDNPEIKDTPFQKISITDNGIGFDETFAHKIFIIFQRLHSHDSVYQGKGIGLAICKRVMLNHNGHIAASGAPGIGATFNLYFPLVARL